MTPDNELLREYARSGSENDFAELVRRHINLVYSAALRQVGGDVHRARDVTQMVFTDLARKARSLSTRPVLTGWLYTSAHFAAAKIVRTEIRRREREEKFMREPAYESSASISPASIPADLDWQKLRPILDDAMQELRETDREAILFRYFENRSFAEVGTKLGLAENAARMRVERALEKLRAQLAKRGIATAATLTTVISSNAVQFAPAGIAQTVAATSVLAAGTGTSFTLIKIMTATKLKLGLSALVVAGTTTALVLQYQSEQKLHGENEMLEQKVAELKKDNEALSNQLTAFQTSKPRTQEQLNELLQLRGEVGSLRSRLTEATNALAQASRPSATQIETNDPDTQDLRLREFKMTSAKNLAAAAIFGYANHHNDQFPTNWKQLEGYFDTWERNGLNPGDAMPDTKADFNRVTNDYELVFSGSVSSLDGASNFSDIIVVREKQPWQTADGTRVKTYGFADGHSELRREPPEGFEKWESEHMALPPANQ